MTKGRRQRDRPKAAPGALYNPNKRVKLSYDSESEGESEAKEQRAVTGSESAIGQTGDREENAVGAAVVGTTARDGDSAQVKAAAVASTEKAPGEQREDDDRREGPGRSTLRLTNPRTGQWHALGSLSWQENRSEEDEEGSTDSAMEYLRTVRSERETIPSTLSGPHLQVHNDFYSGDFAGFASDHAIIAAPDTPVQRERHSTDPREAFTEALKKRFFSQRHQVHLAPSSNAIAALDDKHLISYPPNNNKAKAEWLKLLASTAPAAAQVRSLDQDAVYRLLELIQDHYLQRQKEVKGITSAWMWSLLARLDEVGLMDNDQVYAVRAFGKKAVLVQVSLRSAEAAAQLEKFANGNAESVVALANKVVGDAAEVDLDEEEPTATRTQSTKPHSEQGTTDRENTLATLDTILVIVGDIFGQRDLLEFRQSWEPEENTTPNG